MPIPGQIPIVGSSFDSVGSQLYNWQNFNRGVEEGNLSRQAQAEQSRNNYFAQIAAQARDDADKDHQDQIYQFEARKKDEANLRHNYEFGVNRADAQQSRADTLGFRKEELALRKGEVEKQTNAADNAASFMAPDIASAGEALDKARDEYSVAQRKFDTVKSTQEANLPSGKAVFNPRLKQFVATAVGKDDKEKADIAASVAAANAHLEFAKADFDAAESAYAHHDNNWNSLSKQASQFGLQIGKKNGKWVLSNPFNKGKVYEAPSAAAPPIPAAPPRIRHWSGAVIQNPETATSEEAPYEFGGGATQSATTPPSTAIYGTKKDVVDAFQKGQLSRDDAAKILNEKFGVPYK